MYETRIVEVNGDMVAPLPPELVECWGLQPGMALEYLLEGRALLLKPPAKKALPEDSSS